MAMIVGYWHKDGFDVYRLVDKKPVKQASGTLDGLKPIRGVLSKKVLIISRDILFHTRMRYPPASIKNLTKAVGLEIGELFPISKPAFHCRIFESSNTYTMLDIWAWDSEQYERLREVFPFDYLVPEDLAYFSEVPEIKIFQNRGMTHILAHSGHQFLSGASYPDGMIDEKEMERFLSGLGRYRSDIKRIKIFGIKSFQFREAKIPETLRLEHKDYPLCMDYLVELNINEFKVKSDIHISSKIYLLCRIAIYLTLGYGLMLYLTMKNYDQTAGEIRQKISSMDAKISNVEIGQRGEDYSDITKEVDEKLSSKHSPLRVMGILAKSLPEGTFLNRMVLNQNNLEISVSSKDPLSVVKALGGAEGIKTVRLKGVPGKDIKTGSYNFNILLELIR